MDHIRSLDGLRGLAVLLVILFHFGYLEVGWTGVQLFFVLSGFLITSILVNERHLPLAFYLKRFYWRRTLRIFPIYFAYLGVVAIVFLLTGTPALFARQWPSLVTYTFNFLRAQPHFSNPMVLGHFWSLSVEEQFYLFWPLLIYMVPQKRLGVVIVGILVACPVARAVTAAYLSQNAAFSPAYLGQAVYSVTWAQVDAFAAGAVLAVFKWKGRIDGTRAFLGVAALAVAAGLFNTWLLKGRFTVDTSLGFPINMIRNWEHVWGYTLIDICAAALIMACFMNSRITKIFRASWLVYTGKISYGLYVYHLATQMLVYAIRPSDPRSAVGVASFCLHVTLLFVLAHFSYRYFEQRFISMKDARFSIRTAPLAVGTAA